MKKTIVNWIFGFVFGCALGVGVIHDPFAKYDLQQVTDHEAITVSTNPMAIYTNYLTISSQRHEESEWALVWSNWTNKPVAVAREVNGRLEELRVQHDRPAPY